MNIEKLKIKRTHDEFYLKQKPVIKESFKFLLKEIISNQKKFESLIDIGCSNGSFLKYASTILKDKDLYGADIRKDLIKYAKKINPSIKFLQADITNKNRLGAKKYDVCILDGVHSIFDNHLPWLNNLMSLCNKNGSIYIFGAFNPEPFDVFVKVKHTNSKTLESGYNRLSLETLKKSMLKKNFTFKAKKFDINIDIAKDKSDPLRTYTVNLKNGKRLTINGIEQVNSPYLVIGNKK